VKLKRREKILLSATGGLLVVMLGWFLFWVGGSGSVEELRKTYDTKTSDVAVRTKERDAALSDIKQLAEWQRRALPSDPVVAQSRYQTWLRNLATEAKFRQSPTIEPKIDAKTQEGKSKKDFTKITFAFRGQANWAVLTEFLFKFYSAGHLHQIREMKLRPARNSRDLDVTLTIEAMSLPGADRKEELSTEPGRSLQLPKLADYRDPIVKRDLFAAYVRPTPKTLDVAQQAFVTGIIEVDGTRQVWLHDRLAGKHWKLTEGQDFRVGETSGKVLKIASAHEVIVDFDGHRRRLREGENLRGGVEVRD
jgi:hypothetical protein